MFESNGYPLDRLWGMLNGQTDVPAPPNDANKPHEFLLNETDPSSAPEQPNSDRKYADLSGQIRLLSEEPEYDGNYSKVYKGDLNGSLVAVKVLKRIQGKTDSAMKRKLMREMNFCAEQKHSCIAEFLGHARGPRLGPLGALVSPWYANGDSHTYLEAQRDALTFWNRIELLLFVIEGISFLHGNGIVHGDIKPGNVLLDERFLPKVCDFGLARLYLDAPSDGLTTTSEFTGTPRYLAPELLTSESTPPTTASDVWALGCLGLEYMLKITPYAHRVNNNRGMIYQDIKGGILPCQKTDRRGLEDAVQELLHLCWHHDHTRRPRVQDVFRLVLLLQGRRGVFSGATTSPSRVDVYDLAHLQRWFDAGRSEQVTVIVRPSVESLIRGNVLIAGYEDWRRWALFHVLNKGAPHEKHWIVREVYTDWMVVLQNPEEARIVTPNSTLREYEARRMRGECPFPILPVNRWPLHGEGTILQSFMEGFRLEEGFFMPEWEGEPWR